MARKERERGGGAQNESHHGERGRSVEKKNIGALLTVKLPHATEVPQWKPQKTLATSTKETKHCISSAELGGQTLGHKAWLSGEVEGREEKRREKEWEPVC